MCISAARSDDSQRSATRTIAASAAPKIRVHFIDVGQGAASLFEFPHDAVLVDTGGENNGLFDSASAEELDALPGIGPATINTVRPFVTQAT
jgi:beta-lactamase superfamily II metal-dependent hydrolase